MWPEWPSRSPLPEYKRPGHWTLDMRFLQDSESLRCTCVDGHSARKAQREKEAVRTDCGHARNTFQHRNASESKDCDCTELVSQTSKNLPEASSKNIQCMMCRQGRTLQTRAKQSKHNRIHVEHSHFFKPPFSSLPVACTYTQQGISGTCQAPHSSNQDWIQQAMKGIRPQAVISS